MAQYKVPQNVEAEDKILGPLTMKQFIYSVIGVGWALLCYLIFHAIPVVMIIVAAPFTILFLALGLYQRDGQNFEQLLVALVGFFSQARQRVWQKEMVVESFRVEPTKPVVEQSQRDPAAVRSELDKLASLVDARGWAEPHDAEGVLPADRLAATPGSDRLVMPAVAPAEAGNVVAPAGGETDMMDLQASPLAQNLSTLLDQAASDVKQEAMEAMKERAAVAPAKAPAPATPTTSVSVTQAAPNDIMKLATENELTVSQLAAQANRVVPLTEGESVTVSNGSQNPNPTR